jgi:tetratricopeptide (TPR) repeat protein
LTRYSDILGKLPPLRRALADGVAISYTQWEAWLALYHNKLLVIAKADSSAPRGPQYAPTESSHAAQQEHLARLSVVERYPGGTFTGTDNLGKLIFSGAILELLATADNRRIKITAAVVSVLALLGMLAGYLAWDRHERNVDSAVIARKNENMATRLEKLAIEVAREKGVPIAPLKAILVKLGEINVPDEQIPERLAAQADAYLLLREQWRQDGASHSDLAAVRSRALRLMDAQGDLNGAKALLENARKELNAQRQTNLTTDATLIGDEARIESLQFNYIKAARLYDEAARLVVFNPEASLSWRMKEATAFLNQGDQFADSAALRFAVDRYRVLLDSVTQVLGAEAGAIAKGKLCQALRILGDRENDTQGMDDLVEAVVMCEEALKVLTLDRHPVDWAVTKNSLAVAAMSMGTRAGVSPPLQKAEGMFREVLGTDALSPNDRLKAKANRGQVLSLLGIYEQDRKRFEDATSVLRDVIKEMSPLRDPMTWSAVQNNLGAAYRAWGEMENSVSLLRQAEQAYEQALSVISRERAPFQWAQITDNIARVLLLLGKCSSLEEMLRNALTMANSALEVFVQANSKPDIDLAERRRATIEEPLKGLPSKQGCNA